VSFVVGTPRPSAGRFPVAAGEIAPRTVESSHGLEPEPKQTTVSPELVLVDPELARVERARLAAEIRFDSPHVAPASPAPKREEEPRAPADQSPPHEVVGPRTHERSQAADRRRRSVTSLILALSLIVNAILIAVVFEDGHDALAPTAAPTAVLDAPDASRVRVPAAQSEHQRSGPGQLHRTPSKTSRQAAGPGTRGAGTGATARSVERKVLTLVVNSPRGKLPPRLIDQRTGLAKNGLQAVCRAGNRASTFVCVLRPSRYRPGEGLVVSYRVGTGRLTALAPYR
jgi:hypothetical protein